MEPEVVKARSRTTRLVLRSTVLVALALACFAGQLRAFAAPPQLPPQNSAFLGQWCAQGDPSKTTSITASGPFLTLTNEQGSTSTGNLQGMDQNFVVAAQWQFVKGTLTPTAIASTGRMEHFGHAVIRVAEAAAMDVSQICRGRGTATAIIPSHVPSSRTRRISPSPTRAARQPEERSWARNRSLQIGVDRRSMARW
jgi:hypothetical protein